MTALHYHLNHLKDSVSGLTGLSLVQRKRLNMYPFPPQVTMIEMLSSSIAIINIFRGRYVSNQQISLETLEEI